MKLFKLTLFLLLLFLQYKNTYSQNLPSFDLNNTSLPSNDSLLLVCESANETINLKYQTSFIKIDLTNAQATTNLTITNYRKGYYVFNLFGDNKEVTFPFIFKTIDNRNLNSLTVLDKEVFGCYCDGTLFKCGK